MAGNENDSYLIKSRFLVNGHFKPIKINGKEISSLISPEIVKILLSTNNPDIKDIPFDEKYESLFLQKAEKINEILHKGAINKNQRARVMSALLLSMIDETYPNIDASPSVLINDINGRARKVLNRENKSEFYDYINLTLPATEDNHIKFKTALVQTLQELNNLNIRSAMGSGTDVLGKFYEVFLKYGNGAKEIGIVLTPRHITKFAVEVMNIGVNDIVYDPCCGTGGFLVSAFDYIRMNYSKQLDKFKKNNIFGIEQEPEVVALTVVNMIFRGDGKNNINEGNCFQKGLIYYSKNGITSARYVSKEEKEEKVIIAKEKEIDINAVTKVLMNPPFALKTDKEKEYHFIDCALNEIQDGGLLFSVLPYSCMVKGGGYREWRKRLLKNNTLLSVVTFPEDLFYPISINTVGVFVKKGISHPENQKVLWIRALNDGFLKKKGKRLPNKRATNDFLKIKDLLKAFLVNQTIQVQNIKEFQKACKIDFSDENLDLIPEAYLDEKPISSEELKNQIETLIRENVAFKIKYETKLPINQNETK